MQASKTSPAAARAAARVVRSCLIAVALVVLLPPLTDCWSPVARLRSYILAPGPLCRSRAIRCTPATPGTATGRINTSILMAPASSDKPKLMAQEGDWAAYFDGNFGKVYYFNHETGEYRALPCFYIYRHIFELNPKQVKACGRLRRRPFQLLATARRGGGIRGPRMRWSVKMSDRRRPYPPSKTFTRFFKFRERQREPKSSNPIWLLRSNTIDSIRATDETRSSMTSPERGWS